MTNSIQIITMTEARFLGFIQTDGSLSWLWDSTDRTFRPRVYLTTGRENSYLIKDIIRPWLNKQGIISQYQEKESIYGMSCNLIIERQKQVEKVINLIEKVSKDYPTLLIDNKLVDYLALKYAFKRTKQKAQLRTATERNEILSELVDLKCLLARNARNEEDLSEQRSRNEQTLNVSKTQGKAKAIFDSLLEQANEKSEALIEQLKQNNETCESCSKELGEFIAGILEGDGSFQIGFGLNKRNLQSSFEFDPMFTLTDGYVLTRKHYLMELVNQFFGNQTKPQPVSSTIQAERLYIRSKPVLKKLLEFTRNSKLVLTNHLNRFLVLETLILNYDKVYQNKDFTLSIIDGIEKHFQVENRKYSPENCRLSINNYFDSKAE